MALTFSASPVPGMRSQTSRFYDEVARTRASRLTQELGSTEDVIPRVLGRPRKDLSREDVHVFREVAGSHLVLGAPRNCLFRASSTTIAGTSNNIALVKWQHSK